MPASHAIAIRASLLSAIAIVLLLLSLICAGVSPLVARIVLLIHLGLNWTLVNQIPVHHGSGSGAPMTREGRGLNGDADFEHVIWRTQSCSIKPALFGDLCQMTFGRHGATPQSRRSEADGVLP